MARKMALYARAFSFSLFTFSLAIFCFLLKIHQIPKEFFKQRSELKKSFFHLFFNPQLTDNLSTAAGALALVKASKMMNCLVVVWYLSICPVAVNAKCTTDAVKRIKHDMLLTTAGQGKLNRKLSSASSIATVLALTQALLLSFSCIKTRRCQGKVMRLSFSFFPLLFIYFKPAICVPIGCVI